jgi:chemotaxis protein methyltransferase CheR
MGRSLPQVSDSTQVSGFQIPEMDDETFSYIVALISSSAGFSVQRSSRSLVTSRLWKHVRRLKVGSWKEYLQLLKTAGPAVRQEVVNLLTTNKTDFFREVQHFSYIENAVLSQTGFAAGCSGVLNVWIAACSRGQEAYTLALVLKDCQMRCGWLKGFRIFATDINTDVLNVAEAGIYPADEIEGSIAPKYMSGNLMRGTGNFSGKYRFTDELRSHIKFRPHNLVSPINVPPINFDLIMVRNVFIYFDENSIVKSVTGLMKNLKVGGELMIGLCEAMPQRVIGLSPRAPSVFVKGL